MWAACAKPGSARGAPTLSGVVAVVMRHVSDHRITPHHEGDSHENAGNRENFDVSVHTCFQISWIQTNLGSPHLMRQQAGGKSPQAQRLEDANRGQTGPGIESAMQKRRPKFSSPLPVRNFSADPGPARYLQGLLDTAARRQQSKVVGPRET